MRDRPPRVLVLVHRFPVFSETFVVDHVLGLMADGFDVEVGCFLLEREALAALERRLGGAITVHEVSAHERAQPPKVGSAA